MQTSDGVCEENVCFHEETLIFDHAEVYNLRQKHLIKVIYSNIMINTTNANSVA